MGARTGSIGVRLETTGVLVPTLVVVRVGSLSQTIQPAGGFGSFRNLQPGDYTITIELPFNCTVQGTHPRTATVTVGNATRETFARARTARCAW